MLISKWPPTGPNFKNKTKMSESHLVVSDSLWPHGLYSPWNSPGQNTEVGSLSLLQGIFPTQGSNSGLPHCRRILHQLSHKRSPRILEWVAYPFSSGSSQPRNWTGISCIIGGLFTNWAIREAQNLKDDSLFLHIIFSLILVYMGPSKPSLWSFFNLYPLEINSIIFKVYNVRL